MVLTNFSMATFVGQSVVNPLTINLRVNEALVRKLVSGGALH